jgi:large subunit ribosomal protein L17
MRHRKHTFKIGRRPDHRRALLRNQVCSLIFEGRIQTSVTKAKETRRLAERMVTLGKSGTLHHRRRAIAKLHNVEAVGILFAEIAPQYKERPGGYTRIIRTGQRRGDAAQMCFLEFVEATEKTAEAAEDEKKD